MGAEIRVGPPVLTINRGSTFMVTEQNGEIDQTKAQGVFAEDMFLHVKGEGMNVGCNLTWGPCYDFQRQFFEPTPHKLSEPFTVLKYDIEVSGFGSQALGAGDGIEQGDVSEGLKRQGPLHRACYLNRPASILSHRHGNDGIDQNLPFPEGLADRHFEFARCKARSRNRLREHRQTDLTFALDPYSARQLRRIVNRNGN